MSSEHIVQLNINRDLIPRIVGRRGESLRKYIISPSWRLYTSLPANERSKETEPEGGFKLIVRIEESGGNVQAKIITSSEFLRKFAIHSLRKQEKFHNKPRYTTYKMYAGLPHDKIGRLVGSKGMRIRSMVQKASDCMHSDLREKYSKTFLSVSPIDDPVSQINKRVRNEADGRSFLLGWGPDDDECEMVEVLVKVSGPNDEMFEFIQHLTTEMSQEIHTINESIQKSSKDAMDILEDFEFDIEEEGYSPESP
jgi:hypothetical protein